MKPFQFDAILNYRKRLEDLAVNRLKEAQNGLRIVLLKQKNEEDQLSQLIDDLDNLQKEPISILDLIHYENRIHFMKKNISAIRKTVKEKTDLVELERKNLLQKTQERQIMESLKESQNRAWQEYLNRKEMAMLDELAVTRHDLEI
ncbi:flagellar export protein FliJ [Desulfomarina sp.]